MAFFTIVPPFFLPFGVHLNHVAPKQRLIWHLYTNARVWTIPVLGYWELSDICIYWVISVSGDISFGRDTRCDMISKRRHPHDNHLNCLRSGRRRQNTARRVGKECKPWYTADKQVKRNGRRGYPFSPVCLTPCTQCMRLRTNSGGAVKWSPEAINIPLWQRYSILM